MFISEKIKSFPITTRILIVDDTKLYRDLLSFSLRKLGFNNIEEAEDGTGAYQLVITARRQGADFELIISDLNMPKMDGLALLQTIRKSHATRSVPFILLTTESERSVILQAVQSGVSGYLLKPVDPYALGKKLEAIWDKIKGPTMLLQARRTS